MVITKYLRRNTWNLSSKRACKITTIVISRQMSFGRRCAPERGILICLIHPDEERGRGAKAMLRDGLYDRVSRPDYVPS